MTVSIEIDGKTLNVEAGSMVIEAADNAGIRIPRFCYHKKLSVAANCRMCLVEVDKSRKPLPACATPVTEGMKIYTQSALAKEAQRSVMEFLLINHPLDCPICDQGGQCELQDNALTYGDSLSQYGEPKRVVADKDLGPLIATHMTRCIHCTRCVRFGQEIAGVQELGMVSRGENAEITPYIQQTVDTELSGNMIDLCPVGALNAKPSEYKARAWELIQRPSIAPHDCLGSNINVHVLRQETVVQVTPRENEALNETWISDRDRFAYEGIAAKDRLTRPMIKKEGRWVPLPWEQALQLTVAGFKDTVANEDPLAIGALVSPSSPLEVQYLAQKWIRGLGSSNIDSRLKQVDFRDDSTQHERTEAAWNVETLSSLDAIILVGSDIRQEVPILGHKVRQAALAGGRIFAINPRAYEFHFPLKGEIIAPGAGLVKHLAEIANLLLDPKSPAPIKTLVENVVPSVASKEWLAAFKETEDKRALILGLGVYSHPNAAIIRTLCEFIAEQLGASYGALTPGANTQGALMSGALPHCGPGAKSIEQPGLNVRAMLESPRSAYLLVDCEPEADTALGWQAHRALSSAKFVVALTPFLSEAMKDYADLVLPIGTFAETSGTYVNVCGREQTFTGVAKPVGEARPAWKIFRVLGNIAGLRGFEQNSTDEVYLGLKSETHLSSANDDNLFYTPARLPEENPNTPIKILEWASYRQDPILRRAPSLNKTKEGKKPILAMAEDVAKAHQLEGCSRVKLKTRDATVTLPFEVDPSLPPNTFLIRAGGRETADFDVACDSIEIAGGDP